MKIKLLLVLLLLAPFFAMSQQHDGETTIAISSITMDSNHQKLYVDFKLMRNGKKYPDPSLYKTDLNSILSIKEKNLSKKKWPIVEEIIDIRQQKSVADNLSVLFLVDRSMTIKPDLLRSQGEVVSDFLNALPDSSKIYLSFMDEGTVTPTVRVTKENWESAYRKEFWEVVGGEKNLYLSVLSKIQEMSGKPQTYIPDVPNNLDFQTDEGEKIRFVFTDGKIKDANGSFYGGLKEYSRTRDLYYAWEDNVADGLAKSIPVNCVYIGSPSELDGELYKILKGFASQGSDEMRGTFYQTATADSLQMKMMGALDSIASDYRLVLGICDRVYEGSKNTLIISLSPKAYRAKGSKDYAFGSPLKPIVIKCGNNSTSSPVIIGIILGIILIVAAFLLMQYLLPKISYDKFIKQYLHKYEKPEGVKEERCRYCKQPLEVGQPVIKKCNHTVHRKCWDDNNGRCADYPRCKDGIHYYNKKKKSDPKNAIPHTPWIIAGLAAGLLTWLCFNLLVDTEMFSGFATALTKKIMVGSEEGVIETMAEKIRPMLICGLPFGFFLSLAFSYVLEFKKKDFRAWSMIFLRAVVASILGFVSFFLGSLIIIVLGIEFKNYFVDWIPWLFFALTMSLVVWYNTEVVLKTALIGGAVSVLLCFIILLTLARPLTSMFCFMLYAGGFGFAIAVVHYSSQLYFLHIESEKMSHDVAIYKWMSVSGGLKSVSIGSSPNCTLWMNWVEPSSVPEIAVKLFLEEGRPCLRVLDKGVTYQGRTLQRDRVVALHDGLRFDIGDTSFTYLEK